MNTIMIVEDDVRLRKELSVFFNNNGYATVLIDSFDDTVSAVLGTECDLILLDVNLPNMNGEAVCKAIRKKTNTPIVIITSRNTELDELLSINNGADDFITKPFNTQILLARVERLLKRNNYSNTELNYKDIILDISRSVMSYGDTTIDLSKNESGIFYYLLLNRGKIVSRDDLINYLWNTDDFVDDNTLTVNINRLRTKLGQTPYGDIIITKRGLGYIIL